MSTHTFNIEVAKDFGLPAAVIFNNIYFWWNHNKAENLESHKERCWTYTTTAGLERQFPYLTNSQIRTALKKLIDGGMLITGDFSPDRHKRPTYYSVTELGEMYMTPAVSAEMRERARNKANGEHEPATTPGNPFADTTDDRPKITAHAYITSNIDKLTPGNFQEAFVYIDELGDDLVKYAVDEACANNARTWAYTRSILDNIKHKGYRTVDEAKAAKERREKQKNRYEPPEDNNPALRAKWD